MDIRSYLAFFIVILIGILPLFSTVSAEDDITVTINLIGEDPRARFGNPVMVAGIWHFIKVTLEDQEFQELILKFYKGDSIPAIGDRTESTYYEWKYNANIQEWTDANEYGGYSYINHSSCQKIDNTYSFCLGVKDTLPEVNDYYENWTLVIYNDANELYSNSVVLEKPEIGLAKSHDDKITFNVNPFTEADISNTEEYFIVQNVGNIPLLLNVDYGIYNDLVEITDSGITLSPQSTANHYITLYSESWQPGILEVSGSITGEILSSLIIPTSVFTFNLNFSIIAADLEISVGHSNYIIQPISGTNIVFQYEEIIEMNEGQIKDITVYISGEGIATLEVTGDEVNVAILKVFSEDQEETPLKINSSSTSEYAVTIKVEALRENKVGTIYYKLSADGTTRIYSTSINIGPPSAKKSPEQINIPTTTIVVALLVFIVIGYMISAQIRHRRR